MKEYTMVFTTTISAEDIYSLYEKVQETYGDEVADRSVFYSPDPTADYA